MTHEIILNEKWKIIEYCRNSAALVTEEFFFFFVRKRVCLALVSVKSHCSPGLVRICISAHNNNVLPKLNNYCIFGLYYLAWHLSGTSVKTQAGLFPQSSGVMQTHNKYSYRHGLWSSVQCSGSLLRAVEKHVWLHKQTHLIRFHILALCQ